MSTIIPFIRTLPHVVSTDLDFINAPDYYPWLNALARDFKASRILEVGVLCGYSAVAFIIGNDVESYTGIDNDSYVPGSLAKATANLSHLKSIKRFEFELIEKSTQDPAQASELIGDRTFDFIHIDGDHSYNGAISDMKKFWQVLDIGGHMLIDDSLYIPEVGRACIDFSALTGEPHYNVKTLRGTWVLLKTA